MCKKVIYFFSDFISILLFVYLLGVPEVQEAIEVWLEELFVVVHILDIDLQGGLGNN